MSDTGREPASHPAALAEARAEVRGGVRVRPRVIEKVVLEATAGSIGVARADVNIEVNEWGGGLDVGVSARLPIPDLDDTDAVLAEPPVLDRVRGVQTELATELSRLTGRRVRRISVTVTGATIPQRKRVR